MADAIDALPDTVETVSRSAGVSQPVLALQIDRDLSARVWNGTEVQDRIGRTLQIVGRTLNDEIVRSLGAQESYDEFEARMLQRMGVGEMEADTGGAAIRAMDLEIETEVRIAWNDGIEAANAQEDTVPVWHAEMDDRTTAGCWDSHGFTFEQLGARPPRHEKCRCGPEVVPNPDSDDAEWARLGQDRLEEMAAERESGQGVMEAQRLRPSRFLAFREAA